MPFSWWLNCCFSHSRHCSNINLSDTRLQISSSHLWGVTWASKESLSRLTSKIDRKYENTTKFLTRLMRFSSMNYGSLGTTPSPPSTSMLLKWGYPGEIHGFHVIVVIYHGHHGRRRQGKNPLSLKLMRFITQPLVLMTSANGWRHKEPLFMTSAIGWRHKTFCFFMT
jgi:hypothetical protein